VKLATLFLPHFLVAVLSVTQENNTDLGRKEKITAV
jgi:hypothetical protein